MFRKAFASMLLACSAAVAQAPPVPKAPRLAFEVASIRLHSGPRYTMMKFQPEGPRLILKVYTLSLLAQEAFSLKPYQVIFAPGVNAADDTYYDIVAKAEGDASPTQGEFREMMQTLLIQRFHFKFHWETRDTPVYLLTVDKRGSKLKKSDPDAPDNGFYGVHGRNQTINQPHESMAALADSLQGSFGVDRPVIDKTGLTGTYDVQFEATPEFRAGRDPQPEDLNVFTAVTEQLGLKLEPSKAPLQALVIDHMESPSEN